MNMADFNYSLGQWTMNATGDLLHVGARQADYLSAEFSVNSYPDNIFKDIYFTNYKPAVRVYYQFQRMKTRLCLYYAIGSIYFVISTVVVFHFGVPNSNMFLESACC